MYKASVMALASLISYCLLMSLNFRADDLMINIVITWDKLTVMMMDFVWFSIFCLCIYDPFICFLIEYPKIERVMGSDEKTKKLEHRTQTMISSIRLTIACIFFFNTNHFVMNLITMSPDATPGAVLIRELEANLAPHVMCLLFIMPYLSRATHRYELTRLVAQTLIKITDH